MRGKRSERVESPARPRIVLIISPWLSITTMLPFPAINWSISRIINFAAVGFCHALNHPQHDNAQNGRPAEAQREWLFQSMLGAGCGLDTRRRAWALLCLWFLS